MAKHSSLKVGSIQTHLDDVLLPMGLNLSSMDILGKGVKLEVHPFSVSLDHKAHFVAKLKTSDLASFLSMKAPGGLKNFRVTAAKGEILVEATYTLLVAVPIKANCKLRIHDHNQIHVDVISIDMIGSGMKNVLQPQIEKINPVLDADDFPFHTTFEGITVEDGLVIVEGKMSPKG